MSTEDSTRDEQIRAISRITQTIVPHAGGAASVYENIIRPQLGKRGYKFLQSVLDKIFAIALSEPDVSIDLILSNPDFAAFIMEATQSASLTSSEEKLEALRNAVLNFALVLDPGEDKRSLFLRAITDFTPTHLRILRIIHCPAAYLREQSIGTSSSEQTIEDAMSLTFADFHENKDFYKLIHAELGARGFAVERMDPGTFRIKLEEKSTTKLGDELLAFVSFPTSHSGTNLKDGLTDETQK